MQDLSSQQTADYWQYFNPAMMTALFPYPQDQYAPQPVDPIQQSEYFNSYFQSQQQYVPEQYSQWTNGESNPFAVVSAQTQQVIDAQTSLQSLAASHVRSKKEPKKFIDSLKPPPQQVFTQQPKESKAFEALQAKKAAGGKRKFRDKITADSTASEAFVVQLKQSKEFLANGDPKAYDLTYVADFDKCLNRMQHSGKLLNAVYKRLYKEPDSMVASKDSLNMEKIRWSFKLCFNEIVSNRKTKKKNCDHNKFIFRVQMLNIQNVQISLNKTVRATDHCFLKINSDQLGKLNPSNLQGIVFVFEGLDLKIVNRDLLQFKYKKDFTRFGKESDVFNCDLEDEVDLEATIKKIYAPPPRYKAPNKGKQAQRNEPKPKGRIYPSFKSLEHLKQFHQFQHQTAGTHLEEEEDCEELSYDPLTLRPILRSLDQIKQLCDIHSVNKNGGKGSLSTVMQVLQLRIPYQLQPTTEGNLARNEIQKLYTIEDLFKSIKSETVESVVGILKNVEIISQGLNDQIQLGRTASIETLRNVYMGELKSLNDENVVTVILIEEGYQPIAQELMLSNQVVLLKGARKLLSNNLEIYLEVLVNKDSTHLLGQASQELLLNTHRSKRVYTMFNNISPEIITRNIFHFRAKIADITFIKFEFVCQICKGGTLLSSAKCLNKCLNPRPIMRIFIRVVIEDANQTEAYMSLTDETACQAFGIDISNIDIFKTYFFMHGVFFYKSYAKLNKEYEAVVEFFKHSQTLRKLAFIAMPFCKVGYDDMASPTENRRKMIGQIKKEMSAKTAAKTQSPLNQIYVNGEIKETTDYEGKLGLKQILCLKCIKVTDEKKELIENNHTGLRNFGTDAMRLDSTKAMKVSFNN